MNILTLEAILTLSDLACKNHVVDATIALFNLEGSFVAPGVVPRVHTQPVVDSLFCSPAYNFNCMTSNLTTCHLLVNSRLVVNEIFKD
jgi:hypothetical protein